MLALGLVDGKSWPEDASRQGPHYWRIPRGEVETIHMERCSIARRSTRRLPWFAAEGKRPAELMLWMRTLDWYRPCGRCWKATVDLAAAFGGLGVLAEIEKVLLEEGQA